MQHPVRWFSRMFFVVAVFAAGLLAAGCRTTAAPGEPPPGFANRAAMNAALALGRVPLVDTRPDVPESVEAHRGLVYRTVDGRDLRLDLYRPRDLSEPAPVIVFVHGGSWRGGDRDDYRRYLVDYATRGYVTASVSYRFMQEAIYPAAVDDVRSALSWLAERAEDLSIDPERAALVGGSAGGHLAMMVAYAGPRESGSLMDHADSPDGTLTVRALVDFYGPSDLTTDFARSHPTVTGFLGGDFDAAPERFRRASPVLHVTPDDPPTLVFHGTLDEVVPVAQSDRLVARLRSAGVPVEYHRLDGWPHTMDAALPVNEYAQRAMDRFFERYLRGAEDG